MSESSPHEPAAVDEDAGAVASAPAPLLGAALVTLALIVGPWAMTIRRTGVGGNQDPGPAAFPILLAILLLVGGLWELGRWGWSLRGAASRDESAGVDSSTWKVPAGSLRVVAMILGLVFYVGSIPVLGFLLATLIGATVMLVLLGTRMRWAVTAAILLVAAVYGLFTLLFRVQLSAGFWERLL